MKAGLDRLNRVFVAGTSSRELERGLLHPVLQLANDLPCAHDVASIDVEARNHADHRACQFHDLMRFDDAVEFRT